MSGRPGDSSSTRTGRAERSNAVPCRWFSIGVGLAAFALAVAIWIDPPLAAGFHATSDMADK